MFHQNNAQDSAKVTTCIKLSYLYEAKKIDSAINYASLAIKIAGDINNQSLLAAAYNRQASNYVWNSQQDTALKLYLEAIRICKIIKADEILMKSYIGVAYLYETLSEWDKALDYSKKALTASENVGNLGGMSAFAYHEMASVCMGLGNYSEAAGYFIRAKQGFYKLNDLDRIGSCCSDISRLFIHFEQYPQAQQQLDSALQIFNYLDEPIQAAEVYEGYGDMYTQMQQFDIADINYKKSMFIYTANNMYDDQARIQLDMGNMLLAKKEYFGAKTFLTDAYNYFKLNDDKEDCLKTITGLALADSALGNANSEYSYLVEYKLLSDSLNMERTTQRTRELLIEIGAERQEKENILLRKENSQRKNWALFASLIGIVFLIIAITVYFSYRQKTKANKKLKIAQEQTDIAYAELKEMSGMKDKLFSIMAHDLRSPLANTHNLLQLTKSGAIDSDIFSQLASELEVNLDYNRELLDNLLNWARSQMDGITINLHNIELRKLVDENLLLFAAIADKKQVKLLNNINAWDTIKADENIMKIAIRNTISNAIKFSQPAKPVFISAHTEKGKTIITVKDQGVGISAEQQQKVFTVHTVSRRGTLQEKGAGIGLRITMEMIQKMGGRIWLESAEGEGTTVFIEVNAA